MKNKLGTTASTPWEESVLTMAKKIKKVKKNIQTKQTKPVLCDPVVKSYLEALRNRFVVVTIDKTANDFAFTSKKYYITEILAEVSLSKSKSKRYSEAADPVEEKAETNKNYCKNFHLKVTEREKTHLIMYWQNKMHRTPIGDRFIVASTNCSTNPVSDKIYKIFKLIFTTVASIHNKSFFYSRRKNFWVIKNYFPITTKLSKTTVNEKTKSILVFDYSTLYTTISCKRLIKVLSKVTHFIFKFNVKKYIGFFKTSIYLRYLTT